MKRTVERKYRRGNPSCAEVDGSVEDENTERRKKLRAGEFAFYIYLKPTNALEEIGRCRRLYQGETAFELSRLTANQRWFDGRSAQHSMPCAWSSRACWHTRI